MCGILGDITEFHYLALDKPQSLTAAAFVAAIEKKLHPQTYAQQGGAACDPASYQVVKRRRPELSHRLAERPPTPGRIKASAASRTPVSEVTTASSPKRRSAFCTLATLPTPYSIIAIIVFLYRALDRSDPIRGTLRSDCLTKRQPQRLEGRLYFVVIVTSFLHRNMQCYHGIGDKRPEELLERSI